MVYEVGDGKTGLPDTWLDSKNSFPKATCDFSNDYLQSAPAVKIKEQITCTFTY
ncbi:MAG: hypothetical protein IPF54_12065 [Draconibacterium sp.]|nr:hypothetical protein [Draconibacterium sp.]